MRASRIYAWKLLNPNMSDEEFEYVFNVAEALGCTHTTLELPTDATQLKRIGDFALKKKIYAAYHTHTQATMTSFDQAFAISKGNMSNIDLGHYVAGTGESPIPFLRKYHDRISSVHSERSTDPCARCRQRPVGHGRHANQRDSSADEEREVHVPCIDRNGVSGAGRIGRRQRSREVPGVLSNGAHDLIAGSRRSR